MPRAPEYKGAPQERQVKYKSNAKAASIEFFIAVVYIPSFLGAPLQKALLYSVFTVNMRAQQQRLPMDEKRNDGVCSRVPPLSLATGQAASYELTSLLTTMKRSYLSGNQKRKKKKEEEEKRNQDTGEYQ